MNNDWNQIPYEDLKNMFFARRPSDVDGIAASSTWYYEKRLLRQLFGRFEFTLPKGWPVDYLLENLFISGEVCITDTPAGVIPLRCGHAGINMYNEPVECIIANPVLGEFRRTIGEDCSLVRINPDYSGVMDMINRYAVLLAMCDSSIAVNLMNAKVAFIGMATSKAQANTMKKMFDKIAMGEPAVFVNGDAVNKENFWFNNAKQNFVGEEVKRLQRMIQNDFLTEIGLNNANLDKRERLNSEEVNANNEEIRNNVQLWLDNIREGFGVANDLFGLSLAVNLRTWNDELSESAGLSQTI